MDSHEYKILPGNVSVRPLLLLLLLLQGGAAQQAAAAAAAATERKGEAASSQEGKEGRPLVSSEELAVGGYSELQLGFLGSTWLASASAMRRCAM